MTFLPVVVRAEHRGEYKIHVLFNDGVQRTIDFSRWIQRPIFEPLKDVEYFRRFVVEAGTVSCPNGADVAPETPYARATSTEAA
ncbi:MAG: DUF2442 domain-containing protein [Deltaproteobacteria bacterium]|nr:DUF2442 domain-containing protein [Deltaproteobacteria bacterium]